LSSKNQASKRQSALCVLKNLSMNAISLVLEGNNLGATVAFSCHPCDNEKVLIQCLKLWRSCLEQNAAVDVIVAALPHLSNYVHVNVHKDEIDALSLSKLRLCTQIFLTLEALARTTLRFRGEASDRMRFAELFRPLLAPARRLYTIREGGNIYNRLIAAASAGHFAASLMALYPAWNLAEMTEAQTACVCNAERILVQSCRASINVNVDDEMLGVEDGEVILAAVSCLHAAVKIEFVATKSSRLETLGAYLSLLEDKCRRQQADYSWSQRALWRCLVSCLGDYAVGVFRDSSLSREQRRSALEIALRMVPRAGHPIAAMEIVRSVLLSGSKSITSALAIDQEGFAEAVQGIYAHIVETLASGVRLSLGSTWLIDLLQPEVAQLPAEGVKYLLLTILTFMRGGLLDPAESWRKLLNVYLENESVRNEDLAETVTTEAMRLCRGEGIEWKNFWEKVVRFVEETVPVVHQSVAAAALAAAASDTAAWADISNRGVDAVLDGAIATPLCVLHWALAATDDTVAVPRALSTLQSERSRSRIIYAISCARVGRTIIAAPSAAANLPDQALFDSVAASNLASKMESRDADSLTPINEIARRILTPVKDVISSRAANQVVHVRPGVADLLSVFL